jgi:hypothetical protein
VLGEACDAVDKRLRCAFGGVFASAYSDQDSCSAFVGLLVFAARADLQDELREASADLLPRGVDPTYADVDIAVFFHELSTELHARIRAAALRSGDPLFNWFTTVSSEADVVAEARRQQDLSRVLHDIRSDQLLFLPPPVEKRTPLTDIPPFAGVPAQDPSFVGRGRELHALRDALDADSRAVITQVLTGLGGVGKSALAAEYCHRYRANYNFVRWITASSQELALKQLFGLAASLNVDVSLLGQDEGLATLFDQLTRSWSPWLLVLDNVDHPSWIEELLATGAEGHILITSRYSAWQHLAVTSMPIGSLPPADAIEVLAPDGDTGCSVPAALVSDLDGLPLALRQARAYCETRGVSYSDYLVSLQTRRAELVRRDALGGGSTRTLMSVLLTSIEQAFHQSPFARAVLGTCAYLPPRGTPSRLFMRPAATEEPALAYGDEVAVHDAFAALAQLSLITLEPASDAVGVNVSVHRVVQHLTRVELGEQGLVFSELATRLIRASGGGWLYHLDDDGKIIVAVDRGSGRLLATRPRQQPAVVELRNENDSADRPVQTEASSTVVTARYETRTARWNVPEQVSPMNGGAIAIASEELANPPAGGQVGVVLREFDAHTASLSDATGEGYRVTLPDGRLMLLSWGFDEFDARVEGTQTKVSLDPGWYSRRSVEAEPVVDPTGEWLIVSMETTKHYDHGWLAVWRLPEVLAAENGSQLEASTFYPNGVPYQDDDAEWATLNSITAVAFSRDGARLFVLDTTLIQCWSWPARECLWRHPRPDHIPRFWRPQLEGTVATANAIRGRNKLRCVLASRAVVDVDTATAEANACGFVEGKALAVSSLTGGILLDDGRILVGGGEQRPNLTLTSAVVDRTGAIFAVDRAGIIYRTDGSEPLTQLSGPRFPEAALLAADTVGARIAMRRGDALITLRLDEDRFRDDGAQIHTGPNGGDRVSRERLRRLFGHEGDGLWVTAATIGADGGLYLGNICEELHAPGWWTFAGGLITAMAIEANTLIFGLADGRLRVRAADQHFSVKISENAISQLIPELGARRVSVLDSHGVVTIAEWG